MTPAALVVANVAQTAFFKRLSRFSQEPMQIFWQLSGEQLSGRSHFLLHFIPVIAKIFFFIAVTLWNGTFFRVCNQNTLVARKKCWELLTPTNKLTQISKVCEEGSLLRCSHTVWTLKPKCWVTCHTKKLFQAFEKVYFFNGFLFVKDGPQGVA